MACGGGSASGGGGGGSSQGGGSGDFATGGREGNNCVFAEELTEFDGNEVLLCTEVAAGEYFPDQRRNTVLYVGATPPNETARIVLEGAIRASFLTAPEERFGTPGTKVCAQGEVSIVEGKPQLFVNNAQEIVFLEELVVSGVSCTGAGTN
jgi:hypothetical protein